VTNYIFFIHNSDYFSNQLFLVL